MREERRLQWGGLIFLAVVGWVASQSIRTVNNTMLLQIPGATLTLTSDDTSASAGATATMATQSDVNAAIANSILQTQPQVRTFKFVSQSAYFFTGIHFNNYLILFFTEILFNTTIIFLLF